MAWNPQPYAMKSSSVILCAAKCRVSHGGCSIFIFKEMEKECYVENDGFPDSEIAHSLAYKLAENDTDTGERYFQIDIGNLDFEEP